jgi:flagellar basal body rod protein FlgG
MSSSVSSVGTAIPTLASALQGSGTQVATAAANIANVDSTGYRAVRADAVSTAPGMRVIVQPTAQQVDLGSQMVNLLTAADSYQATAHAMGSIARSEKRALDVIG